MLDFGWTELILIMAVAVLVIGPNEIPAMMRGLGQILRRLNYIKYAVSQQFDDFMKDADMNDIGRGVNFEAGRGDHTFDEAAADEDVMEPLSNSNDEKEGGDNEPDTSKS